jgi:hypothetical protein
VRWPDYVTGNAPIFLNHGKHNLNLNRESYLPNHIQSTLDH